MDVIDILLLAVLIFEAWKLVRETKANQLLKAVGILLVVYFISWAIGLRAIEFILKSVFSIGILAIIILFQPEIRRALEQFG
jgi:diadenylate cyclase